MKKKKIAHARKLMVTKWQRTLNGVGALLQWTKSVNVQAFREDRELFLGGGQKRSRV